MEIFFGLTSVGLGVVLGITVVSAWPKNAAHVLARLKVIKLPTTFTFARPTSHRYCWP